MTRGSEIHQAVHESRRTVVNGRQHSVRTPKPNLPSLPARQVRPSPACDLINLCLAKLVGKVRSARPLNCWIVKEMKWHARGHRFDFDQVTRNQYDSELASVARCVRPRPYPTFECLWFLHSSREVRRAANSSETASRTVSSA